MAKKDDNAVQVLYGVSHLDGITPIALAINSSNRGIKIDTTTSIAFNPAINASRTDNDLPLAKGTSSTDNTTVLPWVVNASTGALLISL